MFEYSFVPAGRTRHPQMLVWGCIGEAFIISALVLLPMLFVETLPQRDLFRAILLAPVPMAAPLPPAAPVQAKVVRAAAPRKFNPDVLVTPVVVPKTVAEIIDAPALVPPGAVIGGIPGEIPGGLPNGAMNGVMNGLPAAPPPPPPPITLAKPAPPPPAVPQRLEVGGNVQAALLINQPPPLYPLQAKRAHIEGVVKLKAVIGTDGKVRNLTAISGNPFLVEAALNAVKDWVYKPTILNGVPMEVNTTIDVRFFLMH